MYQDLVNDAVGYWMDEYNIKSSIDFALDGAWLNYQTTGEDILQQEGKTKKEFIWDVIIEIREIRRRKYDYLKEETE